MRSLVFAAALLSLATPALADTPWTATPVHAAPANGLVVAAVVWNCDTSSCRSVSDTSDADRLAECRGLAREFGELSAFTARNQPLDAAHLAACNQSAHKPKP